MSSVLRQGTQSLHILGRISHFRTHPDANSPSTSSLTSTSSSSSSSFSPSISSSSFDSLLPSLISWGDKDGHLETGKSSSLTQTYQSQSFSLQSVYGSFSFFVSAYYRASNSLYANAMFAIMAIINSYILCASDIKVVFLWLHSRILVDSRRMIPSHRIITRFHAVGNCVYLRLDHG